MNREIKFRAWDGHIMNYDIYLQHTDGCNLELNEELNDIYNLMQFTGLKDKNGKEIYEGDIVKRGDFVDEVVFESGKFTTKRGFGWAGAVFYLGNQPMGFEIIGNIYENPELLTKE